MLRKAALTLALISHLAPSLARAEVAAGVIQEVNVWPGGEVSVMLVGAPGLCTTATNNRSASTAGAVGLEPAKMMLSLLTAAFLARKTVVMTTASNAGGDCKLLHVRLQ